MRGGARLARYVYLWLEWGGLFLLIPLLFLMDVIATPSILLPLVLISLPCAIWLAQRNDAKRALFWCADAQRERGYFGIVVRRFALLALLFVILAILIIPQQLFALPLDRPLLWLGFMVAYPLFSVYPQELVFRAYFFHRYRELFPTASSMMAASTIAFAWMHVVFANTSALVLSLIGGYLFSRTYYESRSLRLVCFEHTLYGGLIFTVGAWREFTWKLSPG